MKLKSKSALAIFSLLVISAAFGAILVQRQVETQMRIKRSVAMEVFDVDGTTVLTFVGLGDFLTGQVKFFPGGTETEPTQSYFIRNVDQMDFWVKFEAVDVPANVFFLIRMKRLDETAWISFQLGPYVHPLPLISPVNNPDPNVQGLQWQLLVQINDGAPFGDFASKLIFSALDSPAG